LSPKTVSNVFVLVTKALNDAVAQGLLATNPANAAVRTRARLEDRRVAAWTSSELAAFLTAASADRHHVALRVAAYTGMRRGEVIGLRWPDVDLRRRTLAVRQAVVLVDGVPRTTTPKSGRARVIDLDEGTAAALRRHRARQMQERLHWGPGYVENDLVFRCEDGSPIHPDRLSQVFDRLVRVSKLRRIRLHDLRHTHATLLLANGVPVKVVSERLGHSDPAFTMKVYAHVIPGMQSDAASRFADLIERGPVDDADAADDAQA
jgi:integrase